MGSEIAVSINSYPLLAYIQYHYQYKHFILFDHLQSTVKKYKKISRKLKISMLTHNELTVSQSQDRSFFAIAAGNYWF